MVGEQKCSLISDAVLLPLQEVMAPSDMKHASAPITTPLAVPGTPWEPGSPGCLGTRWDASLQASEMDRRGVNMAIVM